MNQFSFKILALIWMGSLHPVFQARAESQAQPATSDLQRWFVVLSKGSGNTYGGAPLLEGKWILPGKNLRTGSDGSVKVISKRGVFVIVAPSSEILFAASSETKKVAEVLEGSTRWVFKRRSDKVNVAPNEALSSEPFQVSTANSVMGIRGTHFLVVRNSLLGETELVSFEGTLRFTNALNKTDERIVKTGQWGGLGGRFGKTIAPVLDLPQKALAAFQKSLTVDSNTGSANPDAVWYGESVPTGF